MTESSGPASPHEAQASSHRLRVRFAETDQMGIVHHSNYIVWLEEARVEWLRDRSLSYRELEDSGLSLAVSGLAVTYRSPSRFDDLLEIETRLVSARSRQCTFAYRIAHADDGMLVAEAETRHVPTDRSGRAIRLPAEWLAALTRHLDAEK